MSDLTEELHDLASSVAVEGRRRLVGQDQGWLIRDRSRDRDALLLSARELRRIVLTSIPDPELFEQRLSPASRLP